jgi:hypothetical protein
VESTEAGATRHPDSAMERIQRDHELSAALTAARSLGARLEMAGLLDAARRSRLIRDEIAEALVYLYYELLISGDIAER